MARPVPQYQQLEKLLDFVYTGLRADTKLRAWLCSDQDTPDLNEIVRRTVEHNPFEFQRIPGEGYEPVLIYEQDLPLLAIWEQSSVPKRDGVVWGEEAKLQLLYVFRSHLGNADLSPQAWNARISKDLVWGLCELLRAGSLTDWDETGNLFTDAKIEKLTVGRITRLGNDEFEGFNLELTMWHLDPPFTATAPGDFETIDLEIHEDDEIPATSGVIVEATLDATPSE